MVVYESACAVSPDLSMVSATAPPELSVTTGVTSSTHMYFESMLVSTWGYLDYQLQEF